MKVLSGSQDYERAYKEDKNSNVSTVQKLKILNLMTQTRSIKLFGKVVTYYSKLLITDFASRQILFILLSSRTVVAYRK
jgi:hypothetical protein